MNMTGKQIDEIDGMEFMLLTQKEKAKRLKSQGYSDAEIKRLGLNPEVD